MIEPVTIGGTKAETVTHQFAFERGIQSIDLELPAAPKGEKIGIILIIATSETAGAEFNLKTKQAAAYTKVMDRLRVDPDAPLIMRFPCWVPTQDDGDGSTKTVNLELAGSCGDEMSVFCLYYHEP